MFSVCRRRHLGWCFSPRSDPNTSPRPHLQLLATNPVISTFRFSAAEITRAAGKPHISSATLLFNVNNSCRCDDYEQHCRIDVVVASTRQFDVCISAGASRRRTDDRCKWRHTNATYNGHYIPPRRALKWTMLPPLISLKTPMLCTHSDIKIINFNVVCSEGRPFKSVFSLPSTLPFVTVYYNVSISY